MNRLLSLNRLRWYARLPIKWIVFGLTVLAVCFPYPHRLVRHVQHWRDPNALIEPDAPAIQPFVEELRHRLTDDLAPPEALKRVEQFVYEKVPYEWDWNTWGTADYLPTVTETIEMGKEDCDGRAVVAASLLRNFGFEAQLVTDFAHVWVMTDQGETMGPGKKKAVVATERGLRVNTDALGELPKALVHGVAVFPLLRELIILSVMWLLLLRRNGGAICSLVALALFLGGLFVLRVGGKGYYHPAFWMQWVGFGSLATGFVLLFVWASYNARRSERASALLYLN
ncbi:MAG: transglutaminase domain-containing protein [Phycisphaerae bacterium]